MPPSQMQVRQRHQHLQLHVVTLKYPVAELPVAELPLDRPEHMLDLGPDAP
jgi:hypothetical protein